HAVAENTVNAIWKHRPTVMYYERFNGWEAYNNVITAYAATRGLEKVGIEWVKGAQTVNAKMTRIGSVKGPLAAGRLWIYRHIPGYERLSQQLVKWPKLGRHDDFADCAGMVVGAPTGYEGTLPPRVESNKQWLRDLNQVTINVEPDTRPCGSYGIGSDDDAWK